MELQGASDNFFGRVKPKPKKIDGDIRNPEMFNRNHSVITILFTELISVV